MRPRATCHLLSLSILFAGCTRVTIEPNLDHCTRNEGDAYCARLFPEQPLCNSGTDECSIGDPYGCVAEVAPECHAPCGSLSGDECMPGDSSGSETGSGSGSGESGSSESGSTTTGPVPCMVDEDCSGAATPFCEPLSGECVGCEGMDDPDGACAGLDPSAPLCVGGACVACTPENPVVCDEQLLLCDSSTNTCVPCAEHEECEAGACDFSEGRCFDPDNVLHAGMGQPYATIAAALDDVGAMMLDSAVLVLHEGMSFDETATVSAGTLAIVAAADEQPQWVNTSVMAPTLTVTGVQTRVYLHRVRLTGNLNDLGLMLDDGARVDVRRSRIVQNSGGGVVAQNGAELTLRNCFVGGADNSSALRVENASSSVGYSTLGGGTINATGLACVTPDAIDVRNSIIVALGNDGTAGVDVDCPSGNITFTATEVPFAGEGNSAVGELPLLSPDDWFVGYGTGNFHIQNEGLTLFSDVAQWNDGDPLTDIDGDARPTNDGDPDYAGADVP